MIGSFRKKGLVAASAIVAIAGLTLTAVPAQAAEVGVTATSIKIGTTVPLTGIAGPGYAKVAPAMKAYFDYVNANGGINGRKIEFIIKDDRYLPPVSVEKTNELILKIKSLRLSERSALRITLQSTAAFDLDPVAFLLSSSTLVSADSLIRRSSQLFSHSSLPIEWKQRSWVSTSRRTSPARRSV